MPQSSAPPLPLQSILLNVRTPRGPKLVFHYPPILPGSSNAGAGKKGARSTTRASTSTSSRTSDSSDSSSGSDSGSDSVPNGTIAAVEDGDQSSDRTARKNGTGSTTRRAGVTQRRVEVDDEEDSGSSHSDSSSGRRVSRNGRVRGNGILGHGKQMEQTPLEGFKDETLAKLLSAGRTFHKRRFEVAVEDTVFLGCPMFVREDGEWRKRRRRRIKRGDVGDVQGEGSGDDIVAGADAGNDPENGNNPVPEYDTDEGIDVEERPHPEPTPQDGRLALHQRYISGFEPGYGHELDSGQVSVAASEADTDAKSASTTSGRTEMSMFHVVFVLKLHPVDHQDRVREMYDNVVRKFAKALKHEQSRSDYVWKEAKSIISMREKATENGVSTATLWSHIISQSNLAKAMAAIYDSISTSKIAHVNLNGAFDTSFQIPQAISTPFAPTPSEPQIPGLWLTTTPVMNEEFDSAPSEHSALLLLEDAETLLKEIEGDSKEFSVPLAFFIRNLTPTKSLKKLSIMFSISLVDLQIFAGHLIYWRRARAIPPLHPRDSYIVSPNADMSALNVAIPAYAARFPTLPSLPKMLSELSRGTPRPYRMLFPSPVHRNAYMEILAWLMRGGWVTQLRTYAWVRVSAEVKSEVSAIIRQEKEDRQREKERREKEEVAAATTLESPDDSFLSPRHSPSASDEDHEELSQIASPLLAASDSGSMSSHRTAIPPQSSRPTSPTAIMKQAPHAHLNQHIHRPSPLQSIQNTSADSDISSIASSPVQPLHPKPSNAFTPSLIRSPQLANALESRWLEHIGSVHLQDSPEAKELWPILLGCLDGRHALEDLAPREGLKRKKIAAAVGQLREGGWLTSVRHW